jgi:diguanylate cyclase (GGDEF)-like protein
LTRSLTPARRRIDDDAAILSARFVDALIAGHGARAEAIALRGRAAGLSLAAVHGRIITPALFEIGNRWERSEITVAEEHLATVICHRVLATLHGTLRDLPARKRARVLLATPSGQRHSLGLRMVADVLEGAGYDVTHLGADVPPDALRHAVARYRPAVLGLSLTMGHAVAELEESIDAALAARPDLAIMLGGQDVPERLLGPGVHRVWDIEGVEETLELLLREGRAPVGRAPRALALRSPHAQPPERVTLDEQLVRAAEEIGDVARDNARLAERYRTLAFEDELCGLPNRRAFDDRFRELGERHRPAAGPPLMVMLLDLDDLKSINDEHGHGAGDAALQTVARALREHLREQDLPARLGGDEFGALLPGLDPAAAILVAERVCMAIREASDGDLPPVTVSCGVARYDGDRRRTLIRADQSLYEAKRGGRDQVLLAA